MKKTIKIFCLAIFLSVTSLGIAQGPPDPDPDPSGNGDNGIGGSAPIGNGIGILMILGAAYGTRKTLKIKSLKFY